MRKQKATKQKNTLEAVNNSVKVLNEMLAHFSPEDSADGDKELIRVRYLLYKAQLNFETKSFLALIDLPGTCDNSKLYPPAPKHCKVTYCCSEITEHNLILKYV